MLNTIRFICIAAAVVVLASCGSGMGILDRYEVQESYDQLEDARVFQQVANGAQGSFFRGALSSGAVVYTNLRLLLSDAGETQYTLIVHLEDSGPVDIDRKPLEVRIGDVKETLTFDRTTREKMGEPESAGGGATTYPIEDIDSWVFYRFPNELIPTILSSDEIVYRLYSQGEAFTIELTDRQIQRMKEFIRTRDPNYEEVSESESPTASSATSGDATPAPNGDAQNNSADTERPGDGGDDVAWVQRTLNEMGYDCGIEDGIMGPNTRSCIRSFQDANGLDVTGEINEATYQKMLEHR